MSTDAQRNWFAAGGADYARYRPDYPDALAAFLAGIAPARGLAIDVGCGNGQFAARLADHFEAVDGVDPSADQIAHAARHPRVRYRVAPAEAIGGADHQAALITAAQAAHWFDLPRFYAEVRRLAVPGAAIALISYGVATLDAESDPAPELEARFLAFYRQEIGPYWPPERRLVDEGYAGIDFPFDEQPWPALAIERRWSVADFLGYMTTWSATRHAREAGEEAMLTAFSRDLAALWGDRQRLVRWPIALRLGIVR